MVEGEAHHHADPVRVGEHQVWDVVNETKMEAYSGHPVEVQANYR